MRGIQYWMQVGLDEKIFVLFEEKIYVQSVYGRMAARARGLTR